MRGARTLPGGWRRSRSRTARCDRGRSQCPPQRWKWPHVAVSLLGDVVAGWRPAARVGGRRFGRCETSIRGNRRPPTTEAKSGKTSTMPTTTECSVDQQMTESRTCHRVPNSVCPAPSPRPRSNRRLLSVWLAARVAILDQFRGGCYIPDNRRDRGCVRVGPVPQFPEHLRFFRDAELLSARSEKPTQYLVLHVAEVS